MKELDDYDYGLSKEEQQRFLDKVRPKLEELGAAIKGYVANNRPGHDRDTLGKLAKQLEKLIATYRNLGWDMRDDLLEGIEIRAAAGILDVPMDLQTRRHEVYPLGWNLDEDYKNAMKDGTTGVGTPVDDSLTFALTVLQKRAKEMAKAKYGHLRGMAAGDDAKAAFAPEFVRIVCTAWPGAWAPLVSKKQTTVVDVVEYLFRYYTGIQIEGKRYISEWSKRAESGRL
ncbi:MAG: hypothetical protein ABIK96_00440 [bacterium]